MSGWVYTAQIGNGVVLTGAQDRKLKVSIRLHFKWNIDVEFFLMLNRYGVSIHILSPLACTRLRDTNKACSLLSLTACTLFLVQVINPFEVRLSSLCLPAVHSRPSLFLSFLSLLTQLSCLLSFPCSTSTSVWSLYLYHNFSVGYQHRTNYKHSVGPHRCM